MVAAPSEPELHTLLAEGVPLYRHMLTLRLVSGRMVDLQRTGQVAFHSSCLGEEGVIAGAAMAARAQDWVFPGAREWGAAIVRGLPIEAYVHHAFGSSKDAAKGHAAPDHAPARAFRVGPVSGIEGAHLPQAVGAAWAARIRSEDVATVAMFGSAARGSGDFHNAMNFAGVFKPACVFVCRNDGRRTRARVTGARELGTYAAAEDSAAAYGIASATVDGADAIAVLAVVRAAIARASSGAGATLVEAVTEPLAPTLPSEAWREGGAELRALSPSDPLVRLRALLEGAGLLDANAEDAFAREATDAVNAAASRAAETTPPAFETMFDDVFHAVPPHLEAQRLDARGLEAQRGTS